MNRPLYKKMAPRVIYSDGYGVPGFQVGAHPFDGDKPVLIWADVTATHADALARCHVEPDGPVSDADLALVHTARYLGKIVHPQSLAAALEQPELARRSMEFVAANVLEPMRRQTRGTILTCREALAHGLAVNIGGGFHHASRERGEGFCVYSDVAVAIEVLRRDGLLGMGDRVIYIDLDVHQGNGVERIYRGDPRVYILDVYNPDIYPSDKPAYRRIDKPVHVHTGTRDEEYLALLEGALTDVLGNVSDAALCIVDLSNDIYLGDALGGVRVTADGVRARDRMTIDMMTQAGIPLAVLTSGGYSRESIGLAADMVRYVLDRAPP
jgi:histone deacetylase 11